MRSVSSFPEIFHLKSIINENMKQSFTDQLKELFKLGKRYVRLQVDCIRLTTAEKMTVLFSSLALGLIGILLGALCVVLLAMSAVCAFGEMMEPWLAYLCVAGIVALLVVLLVLLRKPLIVNPIARLISKLIYPKTPTVKNQEGHE